MLNVGRPNTSVNREHLDEILEAVRRIEYDLQLLRGKGNEWKFDDVQGLYEFKGLVDPFLMRKYAYDLLRESWHLGDGIEHWINAKWKEGSLGTDSSCLNRRGKGAGSSGCKSTRQVLECASALRKIVVNLSKHYRLTRETLTGNGVPRYGDTVYVMNNVGKLDYSAGEGQGQKIRL